MAPKFADAEEAAKMLGISVDMLNDMRDRHEIFPVRDAGKWKYKVEEIERLVAERAAGGGEEEPVEEDLDGGGLDSILLSEVELGHSGPSPSSTVIGKINESSPDSDIKLAGEDSTVPLNEPPESLSAIGSSDVRLAPSSDIIKGGGLSSKTKFDTLDTLDLELPPALSGGSGGVGSSKGGGAGSDRFKASGSDILALDDQSLTLGDEDASKIGGGSSSKRRGGSALDLSGQDDDELVLGGSSSGSDLTHSAGGDSGISLVSPSDSGLALDDVSLEMDGTNPGKKSLKLGGDDDLILLEEESDPNEATQLKADDDFLLTPLDDGGEQDSDSGSQVIALDNEGDFDESAATMLGGRGLSGGLEGGLGDFGGGFADSGQGLGLAPAPTMPLGAPSAAAMVAAPQVEEAPFPVFWVLLQFMCLVFLTLVGMMMYDLLRNMWSWNGTYSVNSSLMDGILEMIGEKK